MLMKKTASAIPLISVLLFTFLVGTQSIDLAHANFVPTSPETIPPLISIISPTNTTYETKVLLHLNITAIAYYQYVNYVSYTLDSQEHVAYSEETTDLNWSTILEGLSEGAHSLKVYASCKSYYATSTSGGALYSRIYGASSDIVNFTVVYPPEISILSLENKTYNTNNISLDFTVNEPVSKIEYCLDGQEKLIIDGNVTLTGLSDGLHNVTVYAADMDGYVGISETAYFKIEAFPTALVIASVIIVAVVVVFAVFLLYQRKHKHQSIKTNSGSLRETSVFLKQIDYETYSNSYHCNCNG